jgi:hypothetical protein
MVIRLVIDLGEMLKMALKRGGAGKGVSRLVKRYGGC